MDAAAGERNVSFGVQGKVFGNSRDGGRWFDVDCRWISGGVRRREGGEGELRNGTMSRDGGRGNGGKREEGVRRGDGLGEEICGGREAQ